VNLFSLIDKGVAHSGAGAILARPNARQRAVTRALDKSRKDWIYGLQVDETAAWMSRYEENPQVLRGLSALLSLAALAKEHDDGHLESPEVRVIRGALSAIEQSGFQGSHITQETAQALSTAARVGREILAVCSNAAIARAAEYLDSITRLRS
jgi:hypothetical protein